MLNAIINGISGKMGTSVYERAKESGVNVACGVDKLKRGFFDCPVYSSFDEVKEYADGVIDFSSPTALDELLRFCVSNSMPLVLATTGFSEEDDEKISEAAKLIPIFKCSNTSKSVYLFLKILGEVAEKLSDYDAEIIERHHNLKKDAPSGTSLSAYNAIEKARSDKGVISEAVFGRKGLSKRKKGDVGIHSVRGGSLVGEHEATFYSQYDSISITHTAYSKVLFADGAIDAFRFIIAKEKGLYSMDDLIRTNV